MRVSIGDAVTLAGGRPRPSSPKTRSRERAGNPPPTPTLLSCGSKPKDGQPGVTLTHVEKTLLVRPGRIMSMTSGRAMQEYLVDERLVADTAMFGLGVRPFQRFGMEPDMDIPVFIKALWRTPPRRALHMESRLDGFFKSQCFLRRDPARFGKIKFLCFLHTASFRGDSPAAR